ncbi:class I SAM-dependent methyltransferase [Mesorhizobium sp. DCY119]|uniref:class I SAM-dependent methyltransferase n=1 Tax=Mesorhizobium sp. DCY119 TaxID=2108445 RepID=UPI000E735DED|nr:class I SAM-dependent methyltransferase [Mesorhizobium sp. DCY119]RJG40885.1 class I SAM-dependent methyltransferase [Mesorhizobium sp. DCY119]
MTGRFELVSVSYSKVPDFIRYREDFPELMSKEIDLKDVQRPWAAEIVRQHVLQGGRVLDMGGAAAELAANLMDEYRATIVDPYEGHGNGPRNIAALRQRYPKITFVKGLLSKNTQIDRQDAVVSTSVVEHIDPAHHPDTVDAIHTVLKPGGYSIHAIDLTCRGVRGFLESQIPLSQSWLDCHRGGTDVNTIVGRMLDDIETFFLPITMYLQWKKDRSYAAYPWRKVGSLNVVFRKM